MQEVKNIQQKSGKFLIIEWSNGVRSKYHFAELQERCPCVRCLAKEKKSIDPDVIATGIEQVGRFGIKIAFSSGCSRGIYPFKLIREL